MLRAGAAIVKSGLGNGVSVDMTEMSRWLTFLASQPLLFKLR